MNIGSFSIKVVVFVHQNLYQEISTRRTRISFGSLPRQSQIHSGVNAGRGIHHDVSFLDFNLTILAIQNLIPEMQILFGSKGSLFKGKSDVHLEVGTPTGSTGPSGTTPKKGIKEFFGINLATTATTTTKVKAAVSKVESTTTSTEWITSTTTTKGIASLKVGIDSSMSKLIVQSSLIIITETFVSFRDLFEFIRSCFVTRVGIRMILLCQLKVCLFDFSLVGRL
mmetsp:Transcript_31842/g.77179  ORF Transcript_31842/g.77179 Transcript_31842/m.77179 type:complete len:225 (-) Transcript_31842:471-1145(-)